VKKFKKKLEAEKIQLFLKFDELENQRQQHLAAAQTILTEQLMLRGESRKIDKLLEELRED